MNAPVVRAFLPALREVERELAVPLPDRIRILHELESDLEALRDRFEREGASLDEARRRALDMLMPGPAALVELRELHMPRYARLTSGLHADALRILERTVLGVATVAVLFGATRTVLSVDLFADPSAFLWPVLALGALLFALLASKTFALWVRRDGRVPERAAGGVLMLSGVILLAGCGGTVIDLYHLAGAVEASPDMAAALVIRWLVRDGALLSVAILVSLAGALAWFFITQWLVLLKGAHRDALGLGATGVPQEVAT